MMSVQPLRARSAARVGAGIALVAMLCGTAASAEIVRGFKETWPGTSIQDWDGNAVESNPGTGGHGGAGDGFLLISRSPAAQLGAKSATTNLSFQGDYANGGVTRIRVWVTDGATEEPIEVHLAVGNGGNLWQYNIGVQPSAGAWTEYVVNLTDPALWTQIVGAFNPEATFQAALTTADRVLVRHDVAPYIMEPDNIAGDFGIDDLELTFDPVPTTTVRWGTLKTLYRDPR